MPAAQLAPRISAGRMPRRMLKRSTATASSARSGRTILRRRGPRSSPKAADSVRGRRARAAINRELGSAALRADIAETVVCGYMAGIVVAGVLLDRFLHVWWIENAASAALLFWVA